MDLIYTDKSGTDVGVLLDYDLDLAFGSDENNFECKVAMDSNILEPGSILYFDKTEYGGIVDSIESDSENNEITYSGRTFHGILDSKVVQPDQGTDYLYLTGDANSVISGLLTRLGLSGLFSVSSESSGLTFRSYQVPRYITAYKMIRKALNSIGGKLKVSWNGSKIVLAAVPFQDYSHSEEFDSDLIAFKAKKNYKTVNHLVCLGSGDLSNRLVVHLYADENGNISQTQTITGINEVAQIYDYSNIGDRSELISKGTDHFKDILGSGEISVSFNSNDDDFDIGDIVGAYDQVTGISVSASISKKIISIENGLINISYKVGE